MAPAFTHGWFDCWSKYQQLMVWHNIMQLFWTCSTLAYRYWHNGVSLTRSPWVTWLAAGEISSVSKMTMWCWKFLTERIQPELSWYSQDICRQMNSHSTSRYWWISWIVFLCGRGKTLKKNKSNLWVNIICHQALQQEWCDQDMNNIEIGVNYLWMNKFANANNDIYPTNIILRAAMNFCKAFIYHPKWITFNT